MHYAEEETLTISKERTEWKVNHEQVMNDYNKLQKLKEDEIQGIMLDHKVAMQNAKTDFENLETKYNSVKDFLEQKKSLT